MGIDAHRHASIHTYADVYADPHCTRRWIYTVGQVITHLGTRRTPSELDSAPVPRQPFDRTRRRNAAAADDGGDAESTDDVAEAGRATDVASSPRTDTERDSAP